MYLHLVFIPIPQTQCIDSNLKTNYPLYICILMKLDKVYYLFPTVILVNVIHYYNLKMRLKISVLLMTSCPCHSHSFQRKENK